MIKYTYKDKELKVPVGIGNITNESFEEGYDLGYEEGFKVAYPSGYTDGHVSGVTEQKAKLVSTAITENGTYSREDGFNEVEVDVQPPLETLSVVQSESAATYTPDDGYYGISNIEVNAEGYGAKRWQEGIDYEYNRVSQSAITLSFSGNGEWHKDFFSEVFCNGVIVNVPIDDIYKSGYTSGVTDGFATGHESGYTDGFAAGYPSGVTDGYASGYATGQVDGATAEHNKIATSAISLSFSGNGEWQKSAGSDVFCNRVNVNIDFGLVRNIEIDISGSNILISEPIGELGIQSQGNYYLTTANHDYEVGTRNTYLIRREGFQTSSLQVSNVNFKVKTSDFENWVNPSYSLYFNGHWNETSQAMYGGFRINIDRVSTSTDGDYTWIFLNIL